MMLRRGVGGLYVNGVVARYQRSGTPAAAISLRGDQTWDRYENGLMGIHSIYFTDNDQIFQEGPAPGAGEGAQYALDLAEFGLEEGDVPTADLFVSLPLATAGANAAAFDWRPAPGSPIASGGLMDFSIFPTALQQAAAGFVTPTAYRGAADPDGARWWEGWTYYAQN